jgi:hypothetical protein
VPKNKESDWRVNYLYLIYVKACIELDSAMLKINKEKADSYLHRNDRFVIYFFKNFNEQLITLF